MSAFEQELHRRLHEIKAQGLYRELRILDSPQSTQARVSGKNLLNFASNDYLGLAAHPLLKEAAIKAAERYGAGSGASRLICGTLTPHRELDEALADFKGQPAAISFSSGYSTALGAICALMGKGDIVVLDKLVHASIVDAARLSGATLRVFPHNDLDQLEKILQWCDRRVTPGSTERPHILVVTESVFSMDGDLAPLRALAELKDRYGAWMMVDEAHSTGLYGEAGRGLSDCAGVSGRIEIHMGTLGKALGSSGGYICGSRALVDLLVNRARSFIFSTAPVPAAAAAARAGIHVAMSEEGARRRTALWDNVTTLTPACRNTDFTDRRSPIVPIHIGIEQQALDAAGNLLKLGLLVPAIRYPTVSRGRARLRVTLTANHTSDEIATLRQTLQALGLT